MEWFHQLMQLIESIVRNGGIWFVFLIAMVEALPLIGAVIPGHTFIILAGFLSGLGILNLPLVIIATSLGAIAGDMFGYMIGKKVGINFINKYGKYFYVQEKHIEKTKNLLHVHTGKALIMGRFSPVTRAFTPFFAGMGEVKASKFWFYNIIGGVAWAIISIAVGYIAGMGYEAVAGYMGHLIFWGIIYLALIIWAYIFLEKREHIFHRKHLLTLILGLVSFSLFIKLLQDVFTEKINLCLVDVNINLFTNQIINPFWSKFSEIISFLFNFELVGIYSIFILLYFTYRKRHLFSYFYIFVLGGGFALGQIFKNLVQRIRPDDALVFVDGFSFPSGHALTAVLLLGSLSYFTYRSNLRLYKKTIIYAVLAILAVFVSFSRIYLMVHWFTDVVGGISLGIFWLCFSILLFHVLGKQEERWYKNYKR